MTILYTVDINLFISMDGGYGGFGGGGGYGGGGYGGEHGGQEGGMRRGRPNRRPATDIGTTYLHWMHDRRARGKAPRGFESERPSPSYLANMLPPAARKGSAADTIPAKHLHSSLNKVRHPVNVVKWTPEGRRLLTGSTSGEFTLWNGTSFNFETIMQGQDSAVRAIVYSHDHEWLISASQDGIVKYHQTNFLDVKVIQAHSDPVRDLAFAPTDVKFVTASDDASLKIFDFARGDEELTLTGHQWDAKCVDWHPSKGLLVSGSKDHQVKLWDPRTGRCLTTLHGHKNTVAMTKFEPHNGVLLASCARDQTARVFDLRMMRDVFLLKDHEKEISSLVWHPIHSSMLTTGGGDGAMYHYLLDEPNAPVGIPATMSPYDAPNPAEAPAQTIYPAHKVQYAHDFSIWSMDWHPLGHILASGSNDRATRFWTRPRPGDESYLNDKWHIGQAAAEAQGTWRKAEAQRLKEEEEAEEEDEENGLVDQNQPVKSALPGLAGLPGLTTGVLPPFPDGASMGGVQPLAMPQFGNGIPLPFPPPLMNGMPPMLPPGMDPETLKKLFNGQFPPPPPFPPGTNGQLPPGFPPLPPGFLPPGFPPAPGADGPPGMNVMVPASMNAADGAGNARRRAPLPSQQDSLKEQMRHGLYTKAR